MEESFDFRREAAHAWYTLQYRRIPGHEGRTVMQPLSSSRTRPPASRFKLEAMMTLHQSESPHLKPPYSSLSPCCSSSSSDTSPLSSSSSSPSLSSSSPLFSSSLSPSSPSLYSSSSSSSSSSLSPSSPSDSSSSLCSSSSLIPSSSSSTKAIASNKQWILLVAPLSKSTPSMVSHHMSSSPTMDSDLGNPKEDPKVKKEDDENEDLKNIERPWKKRGLKMKVLHFLHKLGLSSPKSSHDLRRRRRDDCEFEIGGRSHVIYPSGYLLRSESPKSRLPFTPPEAMTTLQMLF